MSEPIDLRTLADVDSPEVVREALRSFRRRVVTRYLWIAVAIVVAVVGIRWAQQPTTLHERIDEASRYIEAHPIWVVPGATVSLERVADLGDDRLGFHFVVIGRGASLRLTGQVTWGQDPGYFDRYIEIRKPVEGYPTLTITAEGRRWPIVLGPGSGVSSAVWRL
jgi:hypothetical protein